MNEDVNKPERHEYIPGLMTGNGWDDMDTSTFMFYDVEFLQDFGPVKQGQRFGSVVVCYEKQVIECYSGDDVLVLRLGFQLSFTSMLPPREVEAETDEQ